MNINALRPEDSSHWYKYPSGDPCYEVPNASKPGQMRSPTVRDARKLGLVPSVTSILRVVAKPGLEAWKQEQLLLAALTLPRRKDESDEDFAKRVVEDGKAEASTAAQRGTNIHAAIEQSWGGFEATPDDLKPYAEAFIDFTVEHNLVPDVNGLERHFACDCGYGGLIDLVGTWKDKMCRCIVDYKSQNTRGKSIRFYPEWGCQLAGYAYGIDETKAELVSLVLATDEPGRIAFKVWPNRKILYEQFEHALALWAGPLGKNFDPQAVIRSMQAEQSAPPRFQPQLKIS